MALFDQTIGIGWDTDVAPDAGKRVQLAEDGTPTVINYYGSTVYTLKITLPFCTLAQRLVVDAFYAANKNVFWTFIHPGDGYTYTVIFTNEPSSRRMETFGDERYVMAINAVGTRS